MHFFDWNLDILSIMLSEPGSYLNLIYLFTLHIHVCILLKKSFPFKLNSFSWLAMTERGGMPLYHCQVGVDSLLASIVTWGVVFLWLLVRVLACHQASTDTTAWDLPLHYLAEVKILTLYLISSDVTPMEIERGTSLVMGGSGNPAIHMVSTNTETNWDPNYHLWWWKSEPST